MNDRLRSRVVEIALNVAPGQVRRLAAEIARSSGPTAGLRSAALDAVPVSRARAAVIAIVEEWAGDPTVLPATLSTAMLAAVETAERLRASASIEVVWTGPASRFVPVRMTHEVVLELVEDARESIVLISYAAFRVEAIVAALRAAAGRGVDVRFVLESTEASEGRLSVDARNAFAQLTSHARWYEWPRDGRGGAIGDASAAMHAKGLLVDERIALVTSANFTGSAMERNMELGLLVRGGEIPRQLTDHFRTLFLDRVLVEISA